MSLINATTSGPSGIQIGGDTSGNLQLQSAGNTIATITSSGLTINNGNIVQAASAAPAFSVCRIGADQSFSTNTWTKVQFNTKTFDTASAFDATTNYRFTPTVAGYYNMSTNIYLGTTGTNFYDCYIQYYKNGSGLGLYQHINLGSGNYTVLTTTMSALVYFNGSTDYLEVYVYSGASAPIVAAGSGSSAGPSWFSGFLARSA